MAEVAWKDLEDVAYGILDIWSSGSEVKFAGRCWKHLTEAGLANYSTDLELVEVQVRFLTIVCIYLDFCAVAAEEDLLPEFSDWCDQFGIELFRLAQLLGTNGDECEEAEDERQYQDMALTFLTDKHRAEIHRALIAGFGDVATLYTELWWSTRQDDDNEDERQDKEEFRVTAGNADGYAFVENGFPRTRDYFYM